MKTCKNCNQELPETLEYFLKESRNRSGLASRCRSCENKRTSQWQKDNPEKHRAKVKRWAKKNPEYIRSVRSKRRALEKGNGHVPYTEQEMIKKYGTLCYICNTEIDLEAPRRSGLPGWERSLWKDHFIPISKGGSDTIENIRPSHGICNSNKHNKEQHEVQTA